MLAAGALTLISGGCMMLAGYLGYTEGWTVAGCVAIPAGALILGALALARRAGRRDTQSAAVTGGSRRLNPLVMAVTLVSGAVMVLAGYAAAAWSWLLVLPLATLGGFIIAAAFFVDLRPRARG